MAYFRCTPQLRSCSKLKKHTKDKGFVLNCALTTIGDFGALEFVLTLIFSSLFYFAK